MSLWPWNEVGKAASPFVQIFANVGIDAAAHILNFVVLMAAVSVYNSAIYSNSRMLYGLASTEDAPVFLSKLSGSGVPVRGILISSSITLICVALNYFFPGKVFLLLISVATCAAVISWSVICITHLKFRRHCERAGRMTAFRSHLFPWANYIALVFLALVLIFMAQIPDMQLAVAILPVWLVLLYIGYRWKKR